MKGGNQTSSTGSVPDCGQHNFTAASDLVASSIDPGLVLRFPSPEAGKSSGDVASPIYQTLESRADALIYQPINSGADVPVYQPLNSNQKSPKVGAEKTSEGNVATVCQSPNNGITSPIYEALNNIPTFSKA